MPIKARIDMLSTVGIRTPVMVADLAEIERVAREVESVVKTVPGTTSAYAERLTGAITSTSSQADGARAPASPSATCSK